MGGLSLSLFGAMGIFVFIFAGVTLLMGIFLWGNGIQSIIEREKEKSHEKDPTYSRADRGVNCARIFKGNNPVAWLCPT